MLTTEELMLVNNLIYLEGTSKEHPFQSIFDRAQIIDDNYAGLTVRDFLDDVMKCPMTDNDNRAFISGAEWHATIRAIEANPKLLDLEIVTGQKDIAPGGGEGESVLLVDHNSKEAIFVFRGTADKEWYDDFYAGNVTDTPQQENALDWYNGIMSNDTDYGYLDDYYITVTGHSKGGNKAKYITIVEENNPVDRCVSLDGQGFSDAFLSTYSTQIAARQGLIENHNVSVDFVNLLLNDVGERFFYSPHNLSIDANFIPQFHSPNTFFSVDLNGNLITNCIGSEPPEIMQEIDELINGLLRSMPGNMRSDALEFIGKSFEIIWNGMWTGLGWEQLIPYVANPKNLAIALYIVEYAEADIWFSILSKFYGMFGIEIPEGLYNVFIDITNALGITNIHANVHDGEDLVIKSGLNQADMLKNLKELIVAGAAAGVAAVATINAKNSEEEHLVHDNMYFGPSTVEEGAEQLISGAEQFAEIGVPDEEYEHKNDYGALSHGGGMYEHIGSAMDETEEEYSGGYNSHGGAFYHDLEQEESGMGGTGSHGLSNGFQMGALAGLEVENNQDSAALFAGQLADNSHGFDEFVVGNGFSAAVLGGANIGANALSKNSKTFTAILNGMANGREKLINASGHMSAAAMKVNAISNITIGTTNTEKILSSIKAEINQENNECKELHVSFSKITDIYRKNEESLTTKKYKNQKRLDSSEKPPLHPGMLHSPDFSHMIPHSPNHPEFIKPEMPSHEDWHDNHTAFIKPEMPSPDEWHDNHTEFIKPEMPPLEPHSVSERSMVGAEPPLDPQPKSERSMMGAEPPLDPQPKSERSMMGVEPPLNPTYGREPGPGSHVAPQDSSDFAVEPSQTIRPESSHVLTYGREPGPGSHVAPQDENVFTNPRPGMHATPHRSGDIEKMQQMGQVEQGPAIGPHPNTETVTYSSKREELGVMGVAEPSLDDARTETQRGATKENEKYFNRAYTGE